MSNAYDNVTNFPDRQIRRGSHGGDGSNGNLDARLRSVEGDIRELKTDMKHVATKAWILAGVLGGMGVAAGIAATVAIAVLRIMSD